MKELTIEEKAQRYDEALGRAKEIHTEERAQPFDVMLKVFPELKESEDERIRKTIYNCVKWFCFDSLFFKDVSQKECLAWLEKQGKNNMGISEATKQELEDNLNRALEKETPESCNEFLEKQDEQKQIWSEEDKKMFVNIKACLRNANKDYSREVDWLKSIKPQPKNEWSEEDETTLISILACIKHCQYEDMEAQYNGNHNVDPKRYDSMSDWLKLIKDRVQPQQKQEWNEDTQQWIDAIIFDYEFWYDEDKDHRTTIQAKINILKSLKDRHTWKPSNEQIKALTHLFDGHLVGAKLIPKDYDNLRLLLEQLKKLREE